MTTVNAVLQRVPARELIARQSLSAAPGNVLPMAGITAWLELNGFNRAATVREAGDYAVRGGIVDLYAPGMDAPVRLDFFGDTLESIRSFDPESQRTTAELRALDLVPMAEFQLTGDTIRAFRTGYVAAFGAAGPDDVLYQAVSEGRRHAGMEHWLPLFHKNMETLFDYLDAPLSSHPPLKGEGRRVAPGWGDDRAEAAAPLSPPPGPLTRADLLPAGGGGQTRATPIVLEPLAEEAAHERLDQIADYYQARKDALEQAGAGAPYKPLPPDRLYLAETEWRARLEQVALARLTPFAPPPPPIPPPQAGEGREGEVIDVGAHAGHNFAAERASPGANVFEAVTRHVNALQGAGKRVVIALWSEGSRERMAHVLAEHGLLNLTPVAAWPAALGLPRHDVALAVLGIETGFETADLALVTEQDILGERLIRARRPSKRAENFIAEVTSLASGDLVVHVDHGIGRFVGSARDRGGRRAARLPGNPLCRRRQIISAGREHRAVVALRLGRSRRRARPAGRHGAWQSRKARMKNRIREIAGELIKVAAERQLREAPRLAVGSGLYDEFCAGFPYEETDDQEAAIAAVLADLSSGRPMDRLICGDVGFGKTEVALRAAFIAAMNGKQVAVVVPTTLLGAPARQNLRRPPQGLPRPYRASFAPRFGRRTRQSEKRHRRGHNRHRRRHPCAARQGDQVQGSRPDRGRRGAAFRRRAQGKAENSCAPRSTC